MSFLLVVILVSVLHYVFSSRRSTHESSSFSLLSRLFVTKTTALVLLSRLFGVRPSCFNDDAACFEAQATYFDDYTSRFRVTFRRFERRSMILDKDRYMYRSAFSIFHNPSSLLLSRWISNMNTLGFPMVMWQFISIIRKSMSAFMMCYFDKTVIAIKCSNNLTKLQILAFVFSL